MDLVEILPFPWPLQLNPFILFGLLLLVGLVFGELARRFRLPTITGFMAIGFVLGPSVTGTLDETLLGAARPLTDVALALVLYQIGRLLNLRAIIADRALLWTAFAESAVGLLLVFVALHLWLGIDPLLAGLVAVIGVSSSPAVLFVVAKELGARGPLTQRAFNLVAINNVVAFLLFTTFLPSLLSGATLDATNAALRPTWQLLGALLLSWSITHFKLWIAHWVGRGEPNQFALSLGALIFALGIATMLDISILLTLLGLGILSTNLDRAGALTEVQFGHLASVFFVILFVVSGAHLHADALIEAGGAALAFATARIAGKWSGAFAAMHLNGVERRPALLQGLTLVPMAALAIGLVDMAASLDATVGRHLAAIVLGGIAIFETLGPIVTGYALRKAGEVEADAKLEH